jgi:protein TonB
MDSVLDGGGQLEREMRPDRLGASATGSVLLHALLFGGIVFWGVFNGFLHHNYWGNPGPGSAMQVSLDSAAIPLPSDQPKNDNVLPSETPSPAPAPPQPKAEKAVDETAIPILGKETKLDKHKQIKSEVKQPTPKQLAPSKAKQPPPKPDSRIQYGEQAGSRLARSTYAQTANANQPVSVSNGDFGTRFAWYVDGIKRKVGQNWDKYQVDPRTAKGAVVEVYFKVNRQGVPSSFRVATASGSPTLDRSCLLATQRVDTFGDLPRESNDQWIDVTYDCTY